MANIKPSDIKLGQRYRFTMSSTGFIAEVFDLKDQTKTFVSLEIIQDCGWGLSAGKKIFERRFI